MNKRDTDQNREHRRNSPLEWLVAGFGLVLVVGAVGFMLFRAFADTHTPPNVQLRVLDVTASKGGYLVRVEAHNTGDEAAAELSVEGTVERGGKTLETRDTTFDFVPSGSVREGGLFFSEDPRGALSLRPLGYREP